MAVIRATAFYIVIKQDSLIIDLESKTRYGEKIMSDAEANGGD